MAPLALLLLSSCITNIQRAEIAQLAKQSMLGMSKAELLACAGSPLRTTMNNGSEQLVYTHADRGSSKVTGFALSGVLVGGALLYDCTATFTIRHGHIEEINFSGQTGGAYTQGAACYEITSPCVRR